jgi:hypothetical protein
MVSAGLPGVPTPDPRSSAEYPSSGSRAVVQIRTFERNQPVDHEWENLPRRHLLLRQVPAPAIDPRDQENPPGWSRLPGSPDSLWVRFTLDAALNVVSGVGRLEPKWLSTSPRGRNWAN